MQGILLWTRFFQIAFCVTNIFFVYFLSFGQQSLRFVFPFISLLTGALNSLGREIVNLASSSVSKPE